jgi:hypothetical protein
LIELHNQFPPGALKAAINPKPWFSTGVVNSTPFALSVFTIVSITEQLGLYLEYAGTISELPSVSLASAGISCQVNDSLPFDAGSLLGLNNPSQDLSVFSGVAGGYLSPPNAIRSPAAFWRVSSYSISGMESATIPAPTP